MRLIVYDLDGTLVDTKADIGRAVNYALEGLGLPPRPQPTIEQFVGRGLRHLIQQCVGVDDPARIEEGMRLFRASYAEHLLDESRLYPGAREVLEYFRSRIQVVITNKPNPFSQQILDGLGIAEYFAELIAGESAYPEKPDPTGLLAVMGRHGTTPANTLLVGDSAIDIEMGKRAGITTAAVAHGYVGEDDLRAAGPSVLVRDFRELLARARREAW